MRELTGAERAILDSIRRKPGLSRAAIAKQLRLSPSLLTKSVTRFIDDGTLTERRQKPRGVRGQPALELRIKPRRFAGLGVSLSTTGLSAASLDLAGENLGIERRALRSNHLSSALEAALSALRPLLISAREIAGVSIWVPAMLDPSGGIAEVTPSQRSIDFEAFQTALENELHLPVSLESKAMAIFEAMRPVDLGSVVFMLFLDYGVGGSVVDRMRLLRGGFGQASNIGALIPDTGPRPSLPDLAAHLGTDIEALSPDRIEEMQQCKEPRLMTWIASRGSALSNPLSAVVQLINPATIVVGGLFPRPVLEALISHVDLTLYDLPGRLPLKKPSIRTAALVGADSMAVTAAAVPLFNRFVPTNG